MKTIQREFICIGRKDYVDFPLIDLNQVKVKTDSGAYTSSINCHFTKEIEKDGKPVLWCKFLNPEHKDYNDKDFYFERFKQKQIKSSNGISETRYIINTKIKIFGEVYPIELSLTDRKGMKYDGLLGRKFLKKKFLIDSSCANLSLKNKKITIIK